MLRLIIAHLFQKVNNLLKESYIFLWNYNTLLYFLFFCTFFFQSFCIKLHFIYKKDISHMRQQPQRRFCNKIYALHSKKTEYT